MGLRGRLHTRILLQYIYRLQIISDYKFLSFLILPKKKLPAHSYVMVVPLDLDDLSTFYYIINSGQVLLLYKE